MFLIQPFESWKINLILFYFIISVPIPTYILGPTEKLESNYFSEVSLENGGELCENVTYLGENNNYYWLSIWWKPRRCIYPACCDELTVSDKIICKLKLLLLLPLTLSRLYSKGTWLSVVTNIGFGHLKKL